MAMGRCAFDLQSTYLRTKSTAELKVTTPEAHPSAIDLATAHFNSHLNLALRSPQTPTTTTYPEPTATTQVSAMTVHHVYVCGRSEEEWVDGLDSPEYVFVEGVCSDSECARTDPGWFREQCSLPGGAAMSTLADMTYELQTIRTVVMANFKQLDDLKPLYPGTWVDDDDLDIDNREALLEQQYHFSLI
ncbi:hypothetical protein LTR37_009098 [Vermiconidia calcicola]|uniref:Uncharacterized protein n=1 Tax=Vermiconidia calcicola TaxID=1690605 RepID=A0ACC3N937_9PEZI|nr:hypothetical protein LTR37_009098 [Vermiconidia calcicola]